MTKLRKELEDATLREFNNFTRLFFNLSKSNFHGARYQYVVSSESYSKANSCLNGQCSDRKSMQVAYLTITSLTGLANLSVNRKRIMCKHSRQLANVKIYIILNV
jgi:hypothetical protein